MQVKLVRDELWLVSSIVKWSVFSALAGLLVGSVAAGFLNLLSSSIRLVEALGPVRYLMLFPGLFASMFIVRYLTHDAKVDVEEAVHKHSGAVNVLVIPVRLAATIITIACGGSVGKEGPCVQIGAGVVNSVASLLNFDDYDRKRLAIVGISAGISAVFGTPITGAVFGVEVLYAGQVYYDVLLPAFIGGVVSSMTSAYWGAGRLPAFLIGIPKLGPHMLVWSLAAGVFFGLVAMLHIECLRSVNGAFKRLQVPFWGKPAIGSAILLFITLLCGPLYLGLGDEIIKSAVGGGKVPLFAFALKSLAMSVTLGSGGSGGVLTPTLFIGASSGAFFSRLFSLDQPVFSALGLVAVLAGATNTPIASTILAMELFGSAVAPFAGIACAVSYVITGHRSLYPGQLILRPKTRAFVIKTDEKGRKEIVGRFEGVSLSRVVKFFITHVKNRFKVE